LIRQGASLRARRQKKSRTNCGIFIRVRELQGARRSDPLIAKGNIIIEPPCICSVKNQASLRLKELPPS